MDVEECTSISLQELFGFHKDGKQDDFFFELLTNLGPPKGIVMIPDHLIILDKLINTVDETFLLKLLVSAGIPVHCTLNNQNTYCRIHTGLTLRQIIPKQLQNIIIMQ
jgi:hypothetical protein